MNKLLSAFLVLGIAANAFLAWQLLEQSGPSDEEIAGDLAVIRELIEEAKGRTDEYGGLIAAQAALTLNVLKHAEAMLIQKQSSLLRGICLDYRVDGKEYKSPDASYLKALKDEIELKARQIEVDYSGMKYSGGLLHALEMTQIMTDEAALAGLRLKLVSAKHGIPFLALQEGEAETEKPSIGETVEDEDAI